MSFRFHVLGVPHTITTPEYSTCAFTQKVVKLCKLLKAQGHYVIHYGHEDSVVDCDEHVTVTKRYDLSKSYGDYDWRKNGWVPFQYTDWVYQAFTTRANLELATRKQPGDFLLCAFGNGHKAIADANPDMIVCESGIGYPSGGYAPYRVFESYAIMHAYQGQKLIEWAQNDRWYDAVIPNCFDLADFTYSSEKDDYFLFLGRVNAGKGIHIAQQIAKATDTRLIVAGHGDFEFDPEVKIERVGVINPAERAKLFSRAKGTICASTFMEPFCGTQIESMLSGTPVISSDLGAFPEYNLHGVTGYRCRTFEQFEWAARNIDKIRPADCRQWAENFSLEKIGLRYDEYFTSVAAACADGDKWYAKNPGRINLDNVTNPPY
jgi:glycosyltransferase involved in cell wall biosynthesis